MSVRFEQVGHVGVVTIDRPARRNALNAQAYSQLAAAWRTASSTASVRAVVITGVEGAFCAGADLKDMIPEVARQRRPGEMPDTIDGFPTADARLAILRDVDFPKPIVAAVGGPCVASGMELLLGTDIRLCAPDAIFGLPEVRRGLLSSGGSTVRLPRQLPFVHAMDILLTGRYLSAEEALQVGLVNRIVPAAELLGEAMQVAEGIAGNSPRAVRATKESIMRGLRLSTGEAYALESELGDEVFAGPDAVEGPRAFVEKRAPLWADV